MFLLRSGAIEGYSTLVSQLGQNPVNLLRDAGMVVAQLRQPNSYLSYEKTADLLDETARQCQEPLFALRLASRQNLLAIGDVALSGSRQPTVGDALSFARQYLYLHASGLHLEIGQRGERAEVRLSFDFSNDSGLLQLSQLSAAQLFNAVKILAGVDSPQIRLHLQQGAAKSALWQAAGVYGRLRFDSSFDGISFPLEFLKRSPQANEELMREHLLHRMQLLKHQYPDNLKAQVCHLIGGLLHTGECSIEAVSNSLDLQPRVLQKRLQAEGSRFSQLLQETRLEIAKQNLLRDKTSITDLALNLGYADVSVFSRHFKQWTGFSPRNWRGQHTSED
ncbi:helix-turn-helix transcriptional regulator [Pseudomonas sp. PB101]|jgi:AraC-like DNA-binding protein|uniref:helix-turn-helix transcriptional regulator n=1 Tax=Pseudomonas sp. PB101 TaxID=2495428 RepID=UPI0013654B34|nr:AraC family transcriptional regulator [Pseudomonas sp. PB101]MVW85715.1 AraC family transcriptional regulator [Pseudomonas sp. PB101]